MKKDDDRHCSECVHYEVCTNYQMYCKALKRRITAKKHLVTVSIINHL